MSIVPASLYDRLNTADIPLVKQKLFETWQHYFLNGSQIEIQERNELRDIVLQSWKRCQEYRDIHPMIMGSVKNLSDDKLKDLRKNDEIYYLAQPVLKQLEKDLSFSNHAILFCNRDGVILDCYGDKSVIRKIGNTVNATTGAFWSESWAGTNAIGTSIILKQPVQLFSSEHFAYGCHQWTCAAAPILDPFSNEVLAVIDLSTESDYFNPVSMMKSIWAANQIERMIFHNYYKAKEMMQNIYIEAVCKWKNHVVILTDAKGNPIWINCDYPKNEITSFMFRTIQNNEETPIKEWEEEVTLYDNQYKGRFGKVFWYDRLIGILAILEKKAKLQYSVSEKNYAKYSFQCLVGRSESFKQAIHYAQVASSCDSNILITGESGTGKELIANAIHQASSRRNYPFVAINCAAIPKDLLASELFGYVGGAFTGANPKGKIGKFELANKGTLFLDEIGDMPLELQVQLLRVLQEQEIMRIGGTSHIPIDVRVIAATNKNFAEEIKNGNFRKDLYYRLNVIQIELPPLRDRKEDIPLLCNHFIQRQAIKKQSGPFHITDEAIDILKEYTWPGNIRELQNVIEYAVNFSKKGIITPESLPKEIYQKQILKNSSQKISPVEQAELQWILEVLDRTQLNFSKAAEELNMSRSTIYRKLKKYGCDLKTLKPKCI